MYCGEQSEVCFGRCRALRVSGRKGNVVWGAQSDVFRGGRTAMVVSGETQGDGCVVRRATCVAGR